MIEVVVEIQSIFDQEEMTKNIYYIDDRLNL